MSKNFVVPRFSKAALPSHATLLSRKALINLQPTLGE